MSARLDQPLDAIIDSQKKAKRDARRTKRKPGKATANAVKAPVGGVQKSTRPVRNSMKGTVAAPGSAPKESTIVVSGLPYDVNEVQIKEYFVKAIGPVKRVTLRYNSGGQSRGIADIRFAKSDSAANAAAKLNGTLVDKRPMKIEVVVDANSVVAPPAKTLSDRVTANPKATPRSATATKGTTKNGVKVKAAGKQAKVKKARPAKRQAKTAEELDAEMTDYFGNGNATTGTNGSTNTGADAATVGEDMGMDEIS